jgi:hypothetical protein
MDNKPHDLLVQVRLVLHSFIGELYIDPEETAFKLNDSSIPDKPVKVKTLQELLNEIDDFLNVDKIVDKDD